MVIIFYDAQKELIYLCTEKEEMQIISVNDPNLLSQVPNDDILYVQNANFITKNQFASWLDGTPLQEHKNHDLPDNLQPRTDKWLHPAHHGAIHIADIKTEKFPNGVELVGKYDFVSVDSLGGFSALEKSRFYKSLLEKGKIEVVDSDYVKMNHGKKRQKSSADIALERITIKNYHPGSAESVASSGGITAHESEADADADVVDFLVEGE